MKGTFYNKRGQAIEVQIGTDTTAINVTACRIASSGSSLADIYAPVLSRVLTLSFLNENNAVYSGIDDYIGQTVTVRNHTTNLVLFRGKIIEPYNNLRVVKKKEQVSIVAVDDLQLINSTIADKETDISILELTSKYMPIVDKVYIDSALMISTLRLNIAMFRFALGGYEWTDEDKPTVGEIFENMLKFLCATAYIYSDTLYIERMRTHGAQHFYMKYDNEATASPESTVDTSTDIDIAIADYNINASQELMTVPARKSYTIKSKREDVKLIEGDEKWQTAYDSSDGVMLSTLIPQNTSQYSAQDVKYKWQYIQKYGYNTRTTYNVYKQESTYGRFGISLTLQYTVNDSIKNSLRTFGKALLDRTTTDEWGYLTGAIVVARDSAEYTNTTDAPTGNPSLSEGILFFNIDHPAGFLNYEYHRGSTSEEVKRTAEQYAKIFEYNDELGRDFPFAVKDIADAIRTGNGNSRMALIIGGSVEFMNSLTCIDGTWTYGQNVEGFLTDKTDFAQGPIYGTPLLPIKLKYTKVTAAGSAEMEEWYYMPLDSGNSLYKTSEKYAETWNIRSTNEWIKNYGTDGYVITLPDNALLKDVKAYLYPPCATFVNTTGDDKPIRHAILSNLSFAVAAAADDSGDENNYTWQNTQINYKGQETTESAVFISQVGTIIAPNNVFNGYTVLDKVQDTVLGNAAALHPESIRCKLYGKQYEKAARGMKCSLKGFHSHNKCLTYTAIGYAGKVIGYDYDCLEDISDVETVEIK